MQDYGDRRHKFHFHNHLTALVKSLEGHHTIIDLRNESCASGLVKHVDGKMNVEMGAVTFYDQKGRTHTFEDFYISSRNIRYVHIPDGLSTIQLLESQMSKLDRGGTPRNPKPETFKLKRAKRYHDQIVKENYQQPSTSKMS